MRVQVFKSQQELGCIKFGTIGVEIPLILKMFEKLPTVYKSENEVQFMFVLEREFEIDNVRVVDFSKNVSFSDCVLHLVAFHNICLSNNLHSVDASCVFFSDLHNFTETSFANHFQ
eukprot:Lithocolla_globosa_v1_NODE_3245_length_1721_cov_12.293517.p2 type:complete len:116 gc:universal NODE_3245_length_1721_cov_12.293517:740-1087(+)